MFSRIVSGVSFCNLLMSFVSANSSWLTGTVMPSMVLLSLICSENGDLASFPGGVLLVSRMSAHFLISCPAMTFSFVASLTLAARFVGKLSSLPLL